MNTPASESQAASFIDKWLAAEPEMAVGITLIPAPEKPLAALWGALLNEIAEAALLLRDPGVAQTKLAWWGQALAQGSADAAHPLIRALFAHPQVAEIPASQWITLANEAIELACLDASPSNLDAVIAARLPLAEAIATLEASLWPLHRADANTIAIALLLRQWRACVPGETPRPGFVPLQLLARHDLRLQALHESPQSKAAAALFADFAQAMHQCNASSPSGNGARLRRIRSSFDAHLLERLRHAAAHEKPNTAFALPRLAALWWAWRAASRVPV